MNDTYIFNFSFIYFNNIYLVFDVQAKIDEIGHRGFQEEIQLISAYVQ